MHPKIRNPIRFFPRSALVLADDIITLCKADSEPRSRRGYTVSLCKVVRLIDYKLRTVRGGVPVSHILHFLLIPAAVKIILHILRIFRFIGVPFATFPELMDRKKSDIMEWTQTNPKSRRNFHVNQKRNNTTSL